MNLIQNNPYRILGVLAGASVREIAKQKNRLQKFLTAEQDPPTDDYSFPALGKLSRTTIAIAKAASKLNLDSDKMTAALFWFWNGNPITDDVAFEALIANNLSNAYDIWQKLTENSEVNKRNASAFQNLSTTMLTAKTGFEKGIHLKLQFLESDLAESFITQVTDETYKTTKKELQLIFLNNLIENIDTQKVVDIIKKTNFSAKVDFLKSVSQKLISKISTEIETAQKKRIANKTNAAQAGEILYNNSKADLEQLKFIETHSYTRINNTQKNKNGIFISGQEEECNYSIYYSNIADKVANEILQCGIDYFNEKHENISNEDIDCVINLVDFAKFIAIGKIMQERIEENRKIITGIKYYNLCYYCGRTIANATSAYKKTI
jgi:hypothetical protein